MGRYIPLCALKVQHEFFEGSPDSNHLALRFLPSLATAELIRREDLLLRERINGIEIWQVESDKDSVVPAIRELDLTFLVSSKDPHFNFYTDLDLAKPINFINQEAAASSEPVRLTAQIVEQPDFSLFGLSSFENRRAPALFTVQLRHQISAQMTHYLVELKARPLHWKYVFSGALAKKKLEIIDLEAGTSNGCRFNVAENSVTTGAVAFISELPLPMKGMPTQRFQLREAGAAGRVLMRRLPNASIDKVGKERGPDGQSLVVAEIYIHQ